MRRSVETLIGKGPKLTPAALAMTAIACGLWSSPVHAAGGAAPAEVNFDASFLMQPAGSQHIDVSRFAHGNPIAPGEYAADIHLNGTWLGRRTIRFEGLDGQAKPCFDQALIAQLNLESDALAAAPQTVRDRIAQGRCVNIDEVIDGASYSFDLAELRLDIAVPQAVLRHTPKGYVNPEFWDAGVPSATLAYNLNRYETRGRFTDRSTYLSLDTGVNIGSWHFRQRSTANWQTTGPRQFQNIATYVQHDIPSMQSQLTFGDSFTDGAVFDSMGLRGVQLSTDDRMRPESQRGYAPLIRGIAQSNARVAVTQNGIKLHETTVPPGPFEINDLYATGYGGDLRVSVTEADGSEHSFSVPYASVAQLLRPGTTRYSAAFGRARNGRSTSQEEMLQLTVQHGFTNVVTGYGGLVASKGYQAGVAGAALNTPAGAFALDVTRSHINKPGLATGSGQSIRASYSKFVPATGTNLAVAAFRHSSSGYWSVRDAMLSDARNPGLSLPGQPHGPSMRDEGNRLERRRNEMQVTLNQTLGEGWGNLYAVASTSDYWSRSGRTTQFQVGYSNTFRAFGTAFSFNIAASRQRDGRTRQMNNEMYVGVSIPLGSSKHPSTLSLAMTRNSRMGSSQQAMLTGSASEDNALTYGISANRSPDRSTGGGNIQYRGSAATVSASASSGSGYAQYAGSIKGAIVAHPGGITLANDLGETIGIVEAKDAKGARIANAPGVQVDSRGYAVIPYLTPYSLNNVELDPKGLPLDVELKETSTQVAPRANSVVMIQFATVSGRAAMFNVMLPGNAAPPFGSAVLNDAGAEVGVVGQGGRVLVRGVEDAGTLSLRWGAQADQFCRFDYQLPERNHKALTYPSLAAQCISAGEVSQ